jgi:hypothetical protein
MPRQIGGMLGSQPLQARNGPIEEDVSLQCSQCRVRQHLPAVRETHAPGVEGRVPQGGKQQAVVDVEALGVVVALSPRHDVRCSGRLLQALWREVRALPIGKSVREDGKEP